VSSRIRQHIRNNVVGYIALFLVVTGGTAQALTGSNTVFTDDIVNKEVKTADLGYGAVIANRLAPNSVRSGRVVDESLTGADIGGLTGNDVAVDSLTGANVDESTLGQVPQAGDAANANSANNAIMLGGVPAAGFMRVQTKWKKLVTVGERYPVEIGNPACSGDRSCTASLRCDAGDVLLSGGYNRIDEGTRIFAAFPFNANGYDHKYVMHWENNSTADEVELNIICADQ
jgi:hypothetical protein